MIAAFTTKLCDPVVVNVWIRFPPMICVVFPPVAGRDEKHVTDIVYYCLGFIFFSTRCGHGKDGLCGLLHLEDALHDQEHDDGQQGRENGAEQVVRAAILGHGDDLRNDEPNQIHPRDGGAERETGDDKLGRLGGELAGNLGHGTHLLRLTQKKIIRTRTLPPGQSWNI